MSTEDDPTLTPTQDMSAGARTEISTRPRTVAYRLGDMLGKGGMGEVWSAKDDRMGREVALKRMRTQAPTKDEMHRFLREARIQALLDHPAIVPVFEQGTDDEGFPYFTMKKLVGTTLAKLLDTGTQTQQRLLRVLVDVCQAIDLAHTKNIVHRDLKPSNIMLGDFGEVYVLDWGVARILDEVETPSLASLLVSSQGGTRTGQMLGTPGYMAPEQVRGIDVSQSADVYALGSILFEILAGETLHPRGAAALASTLDRPQASPASRTKRTIAPELDELCSEALAEDPNERPTARELGERIQQYLDGDRDLERRRVLATKLVVQGRASLDAGDRADAVRFGGRALALDQNNVDAAGLVMSIVTSVPETLPPEVEKQLVDHDRAARRERSRRAIVPMVAFFMLTPFLALLEVTNWPSLIAVYAAIGGLAALAVINWRTGRVPIALWLTGNIVMVIIFTRLSGPFVITPIVIVAVLISASAQSWLNERRWAFVLIATVMVVSPFVLEELGVFGRSWTMSTDGVISQGTVFLRGQGNVWPLFTANLLCILLCGIYALAVTRDRRLAQRQLIVQTWQLTQLLPRQATERTMTS